MSEGKKKFLHELRQQTRLGCSDGGCVFVHPGGMQTNGGCKCMDQVITSDVQERRDFARRVARFIRSIRVEFLKP